MKDEHYKLHTKLQIQENELIRKDKLLEEFIIKQSGQSTRQGNFKAEPQVHLISALKRQIKESKGQLALKEEELTSLKKNLKSTKLQE